jgi:hypothetical protein
MVRIKKHTRLVDLLVITALVILAIPLTVYGKVNFLTSTLLFFGLPSTYLIWRRPRNFKKATLAGVILGLVLGFSFDFVAEFNHAWGWSAQFALPINMFGVVSLDVMVWYFLWVFLVVAYYEYFIEHDRSTKISPHAKWVLLGGLVLAISIVAVWHIAPSLLLLHDAYAKLGIVTFIICAALLFKNPHLLQKVLGVVPFFAFMYLAYEITALSMHLWTFPGAYIGSVTVGAVSFPIEELIVWIFASSAIVATYYEFCIDDGR